MLTFHTDHKNRYFSTTSTAEFFHRYSVNTRQFKAQNFGWIQEFSYWTHGIFPTQLKLRQLLEMFEANFSRTTSIFNLIHLLVMDKTRWNKTKRFAKQLASEVVIAKLIFKNWRPNFNSHTHTLKMCDNERKISMAQTQSLNVPYKRVHQNVWPSSQVTKYQRCNFPHKRPEKKI